MNKFETINEDVDNIEQPQDVSGVYKPVNSEKEVYIFTLADHVVNPLNGEVTRTAYAIKQQDEHTFENLRISHVPLTIDTLKTFGPKVAWENVPSTFRMMLVISLLRAAVDAADADNGMNMTEN